MHVDSERFEKKLKSHSVQLGQVSSIWISFCTWISFGNIWWQKPWETVWNMLSMMVLRRQDAIVTSRFSPAWEHAQPAYPILTSRGSQTVWLSSSKINEHCQICQGWWWKWVAYKRLHLQYSPWEGCHAKWKRNHQQSNRGHHYKKGN